MENNNIIQMHSEGLSCRHMETILEIDRKTIAKILKDAGLQPNYGGRTIKHVDATNVECTKCFRILPLKELPWGRVTTNPYQLSYCRNCLTAQSINNTKKSIAQYLAHRQRALKHRANTSDNIYDLPMGYLYDLYLAQDGKCFYTDIPLVSYFGTKKSGNRDDSISVDQILPRKGYTTDNIVLCSARVNTIKSNCTLAEMSAWLPGWHKRLKDAGKI